MQPEPDFASDLYQGAAESYDRFRLPYPEVLTADLISRVRPSRQGQLLDLACGTGQLAFALVDFFAVIWAVDQEPDMARLVEVKAARGRYPIRAITSSAEDLAAESAMFELITIGNAFHRLRRDHVARRTIEWLRPGGHLALCWSSSPWEGHAGWQKTLSGVLGRWRGEMGACGRLPQGWAAARQAKPDHVVLTDAGFESIGRYEFQIEHRWTTTELAGFVYSTSFLAAPVLAERAAEFEADLTNHLEPHLDNGALVDQVSFAYDLFQKPAT